MTTRVRVPGRRRRLARMAAAAVVGAPVIGLALLAGPAASADPAGTVTFTGGCGVLGSGLGGSSSPDTERVSLPAGTELRFANQLGRAARLRLDGEAAADVPAGGTADVVFHDGPVLATMQINCLLGEPAGAVTVEVAPAPQPEQPPSAGPAEPDPPASSGTGTDPAGGSGSGTGSPPFEADPDGGWWPDAPPAPGGETSGSAAGEPPPHGAAAPNDGLSPRWGLATEPSTGGDSSTDPATVDPQAAGGVLTGEERLSRTSGSGAGDRASGLLALVATVCLVGVSAGAIRVIISQRADRTTVG